MKSILLYRSSIKGFALIEVLVALTIVSISFVTIFSSVSKSVFLLSRNKNYSKAMMIARTKLNEFIIANMRESDAKDEVMEEYPDFKLTRETKRFEHPMLVAMPLPLYVTEVAISWKEGTVTKKYELTYVYPKK